MPIGIPDHAPRRYTWRSGEGSGLGRARGVDALRAFADDLLETGDPRLTLDRAFRWGYQDHEGSHVPGLQEQLQDLRHQRDRLLRQIEHHDFLDVLSPELDRLDAADGRERAAKEPAADRLLDRIEQGYATEEARQGLDALRLELGEFIGEPRGPGQAGGGHGDLRGARSARTDRLRQVLFEGGAEVRDPGQGAWRRPSDPRPAVEAAQFDLRAVMELERIESALRTLETVGSVAALPEDAVVALQRAGMDDLAGWLRDWEMAAADALPSSPAAAELPPEVIGAISRDLLKGLFRTVSSPLRGEHAAMAPGTAGDPSEATVAWEPGRPIDLDLVATVSAAVRGGRASAGRVRLAPDDFQVIERGSSVAVSTVLAIDRSRSMGQGGGWIAARKVALAMHELIRQSYPRDSLDVIAFSSTAERVNIADVPLMAWDRFEHGTHVQAALALGRTLLRRARAGTRQIVVITDGEPTLATVRGTDLFASPPTPEVLEATMTEVVRCTREGVAINLVMLGGAGRSDFAEQVARVNRGRVFSATSETLGSYVLRDYVSR